MSDSNRGTDSDPEIDPAALIESYRAEYKRIGDLLAQEQAAHAKSNRESIAALGRMQDALKIAQARADNAERLRDVARAELEQLQKEPANKRADRATAKAEQLEIKLSCRTGERNEATRRAEQAEAALDALMKRQLDHTSMKRKLARLKRKRNEWREACERARDEIAQLKCKAVGS